MGFIAKKIGEGKRAETSPNQTCAAMVAKAVVAQEWTYVKARLYRQVHYFRVGSHSVVIGLRSLNCWVNTPFHLPLTKRVQPSCLASSVIRTNSPARYSV